MSFDSIGSDPVLRTMFDSYRGREDLLPVFADGVTCGAIDWADVTGDADAEAFQAAMKRCPGFALIYTVVLLRRQRRHWGRLNRREVECRADAIAC